MIRGDVVVFLGPSLARDTAAAILDADYQPPARFGDVYRRIGGVARTIVVIDGVFHGHPPVWHRELRAALHAGLRVYGAASMGALRAAELRTDGMIGIGEVYDAYAAGALDGDDEVALLHADREQHYRPLSVPLVNLRATLRDLVARGLLDAARVADAVARLKAQPFWERTLEAAAAHLGQPRDALAAHLVDVKQRDAVQALTEIARAATAAAMAPSEPSPPSSYDRFRLLERAYPGGDRGVDIVERLLADRDRRILLRWTLGARFFVTQLARDADPPILAPAPSGDGLLARALTATEHAALAPRQAAADALVSDTAAARRRTEDALPGAAALLDPSLLTALPDGDVLGVASRAAIARALPWVAAWCARAGAAPPPDHVAAQSARWRDALARLPAAAHAAFLTAVWAVERGPVYFGHATWSFSAELLALLQWTCALARDPIA